MYSSKDFIHKLFREYYEENFSSVIAPSEIEKREFGFILFKEGMLRHKSFKSEGELRRFMASFAPSDAYYSCAYYERPEAEMDEKGWLGADLIFDIDADHIRTPCKKIHDKWICMNCGFSGRGLTPERCPNCGMGKFEEKTWPCEVCLETAKNETMKLINFLSEDFGFSPKELRIYFSGHRGYHVHIESKLIQDLDTVARKEIVDYIIGLGLDVNFHGFNVYGRSIVEGPSLDDSGWRGRIAKGTYEFLLRASASDLKRLGLRKSAVEAILSQRDYILENWGRRNPWALLKGVGGKIWMKIAEHGAKLQASQIDTVVTTDIHRLIRLNGSLHGKTGFRKIEVPQNGIEGFDPLKEAIAFRKGTITVAISEAPELRVGEEIYGPFKECKVELPTAVAVLLLCKGAAEVAE